MKPLVFCILTSISLLISACSFTPKFLEPSQQAVTIPLGGNTYITVRGECANGRIAENGIHQWINPSTVYSVFFRISKPGKMSLFLKYNAPAESEILVTSGKKAFNVKLHEGTDQTAFIGVVAQADTGYVRIDLQGKERLGEVFANAVALIVDGEVTAGKMNFVGDFSFYWGRRGPSVHLSYPFPESEDIEWFYNEITVPVGEDPVGSYYMANGFAEGYFGIQVNSPTERRILFSVWSPFQSDNPKDVPEDQRILMLKKGEDVYTGEFGNEGSGRQSYLRYMWIAGNTYKFLTRVRPNGKGATEYTSWFFAPELGKWRLIAKFLRPKTDTWYKRAHSFLESFNPELGYISRKGYYGNQWARTADGRWIELPAARFTADETARRQARMDYKGGASDGQFFMQNCGFLNDYTVIGSTFSRPANGIEPTIDWEHL